MENPMKSLPRNVILDLLPAYLAGEASEESRVLVEEYAKNDPEIARLIRTGELESDVLSPNIPVPDDLEMKTMKRLRYRIRRQLWFVALGTASILMIPLVAMLFTDEVNWNGLDFAIMGILLFGAGLIYVLITRISDKTSYRIAVGVAVLAGLFLIWINLAVGIIGSEGNPANLLYAGVLAVGIVGAGITRLKPGGMARTMFATAIAQLLVPVVAMIFWRPALEEAPGIAAVFMLNAVFALMFAVSGLLFRHSMRTQNGGDAEQRG